ncbi:ABC transporter ATP-binding protein [Planctomycetota bacterium]
MTLALEITGVSKSYGDFQAVKNISTAIPAGCICGFLGPNGAGKTSTIRMIMNIVLPDTGDIKILGTSGRDNLTRVGYLPEERGLYRKMTVREVIIFFGELKGMSRSQCRQEIDSWLQDFGLAEWASKKVQDLSKGMQQKIQFITTVIHNPDLLILDEPFSGMDPVNTEMMIKTILRLKQEGKTILFSTHIMEQAEKICDIIVLINKGEIILDGKLADVKEKYGRNTVRLQLGNGDFDWSNMDYIASVQDKGEEVLVMLREGAQPQQLLKDLVGRCEVLKFTAGAPPLHDIFINLVGGEDAGV